MESVPYALFYASYDNTKVLYKVGTEIWKGCYWNLYPRDKKENKCEDTGGPLFSFFTIGSLCPCLAVSHLTII